MCEPDPNKPNPNAAPSPAIDPARDSTADEPAEPGERGDERRVIVVLGCTASGKGRLARLLAKQLRGEIISIDSMKVYRRMNIGTATPGADELDTIPHHMVNILDPHESFSVAQFVELADTAIEDIHRRGKPAICVGGTVLYFKAFYHGLFEGPGADPQIRNAIKQEVESRGLPALYAELKQVDPDSASRIHPNDQRRIERALEVYRLTDQPISELQQEWTREGPRRTDWDWNLLGIYREKSEANRRINQRVHQMISAGLVDEARELFEDPQGLSDQAIQAVGYPELFAYFRGECPLDYAIEQIKIHSRRLAKSQRTWLRRIPGVRWIEPKGKLSRLALLELAFAALSAGPAHPNAPPHPLREAESPPTTAPSTD